MMIEIIFNPFWGNHVYIDIKKDAPVLGKKYAGAYELIGELRLRAGLTSVVVDNMERIAHYMNAITAALNDEKDSYAEIFRTSFDNDRLGVATTLLKWRDTLVGIGWKASEYMESPKLNALKLIEKYFAVPGYADCRKELLESLESENVSLSGVSIASVLPEDMLPNYFARLLKAAAECGAAVSYLEKPSPSAPEGTVLRSVQDYLLEGKQLNLSDVEDDDTFKLYRFQNTDDALKYAALSKPDVISASDAVLMREVFRAMNMPLPMATDSSVPQVVRLLPLALSLRKTYTDVNSLLAFLSIEPNPFSSLRVKMNRNDNEWHVSLNKILREHLLSNGGFGEEWHAMLQGDMYDWDGEVVKNKQILDLLEKVELSDGKIHKDTLKKILKLLSSWSAKDMESRGALLRYCRFTEILLEYLPDVLEVESLVRWLSSAGVPVISSLMPAEVGACDVIRTPSSLISETSSMCWADCYYNGKMTNELEFLSPADINELGVTIDTAQRLYEAERYSLSCAISKVKKKLLVLTADKESEELIQDHPLVIELQSRCGLKEDSCSYDEFMSLFDVTGVPERKIEHNVGKECFNNVRQSKENGGLRRDVESYSSIEKLINFPFDYVMDYLLHWKAYGVESMSDMQTTKGTVAHRYIELLLKDSDNDISKAKQIHRDCYVNRVEECIREKGAVMFLDENRLERASFIADLDTAVKSLLKFIENNNMTVVSTEQSVDTELPVIGRFTGNIDLLLSDQNNDLVIVDMKWTNSKTYNNRLKEDDILQLALYRKALESKDNKVVCEGYFVLPQRKFLTSSTYFKASDVVDIIEKEINIGDHFALACNSYEYRIQQIEQGIIEDAEGADLADIQYFNDMSERELYPLKKKYQEETKKGFPYGETNLILKGGLE